VKGFINWKMGGCLNRHLNARPYSIGMSVSATANQRPAPLMAIYAALVSATILLALTAGVAVAGQPITVETEYLLARAKIGDADSQFSLGVIYENIGGGRKSLADDAKRGAIEAAKWYRLAAEQGHAAAQYSLADLYDGGRGVREDHAEATKWFRRAAEKGHAAAQRAMGDLYNVRGGTEKNDVEAAKWYRLAADQGNSEAQFSLGVLYDEGRGVPEDAAEAMKWFRSSAALGNPDALNLLKIRYENIRVVRPR
jgi:TPR repeat protein